MSFPHDERRNFLVKSVIV